MKKARPPKPYRPYRRPFGSRPGDNVGETCSCLECRAANVTDLERVRVPADRFCSQSRWLHGEELRAWWSERNAAIAAARATLTRTR